MGYSIFFTHNAEKDLAKLSKKDIEAVLTHCALLEKEQPALDIKKLHPPLKGFRLRVGTYRVLYIKDANTITVHAVMHRKDAYR